jgi:MFS family permease
MPMWLSAVSMSPDSSALPGIAELTTLTNGLGAWALGLALAALLVGAALWALGAHAQNFQQSMVGRRAVLIAGLAALLIGAAPELVNFFFSAGQAVHQ